MGARESIEEELIAIEDIVMKLSGIMENYSDSRYLYAQMCCDEIRKCTENIRSDMGDEIFY